MKRVLLIGFAMVLFGFAATLADGRRSHAYALSSAACLVGTDKVCSTIITRSCERWVRMFDWGHMVYWFCWKWRETTEYYYWSKPSSGGGGSGGGGPWGDHPLSPETPERVR